MKKRIAIIGALVSLLPMGQPLMIGTGAALTTSFLIHIPKVYANTFHIFYDRGVKEFDRGNFTKANLYFTKAIDKLPINPEAYIYRGVSRHYLNDNYGAISDYTKAIEINSKNSYAYFNRGLSKERLGDLKGACSDWRKASSLGDKDAANSVRDQC